LASPSRSGSPSLQVSTAAKIVPSTLHFYCIPASVRCYPQYGGGAFTLKNTGTGTLVIYSIKWWRKAPGVSFSTNCPQSLRAGGSCTINVNWVFSGYGYGAIAVSDNAGQQFATVYISS
jgi:hypothetical protein